MGRPTMTYLGLNVGSGPWYAEGWFNIDALPTETGKQPDRLMLIEDLPLEYGRDFEKAYVGHVLEHIEFDAVPAAVAAITAVVKPGGPIMFVGPCMDKAISGGYPEELLAAIRVNPEKHEPHPWGHSWTPTEALTLERVTAGGLTDARVVNIGDVTPPEWPNPTTVGWQTAILATAV